jgi:hypothetical protein
MYQILNSSHGQKKQKQVSMLYCVKEFAERPTRIIYFHLII